MNDKISALMDGELDDKSTAEMIDWLGRDGDALHAWRAYHLISDAMRDSRTLSEGFTARVAARLSAEPALLAPARLQAEPRKWLALSAAASVAAVSLVGWLAFAPQRDARPQMAQAPAGTPVMRPVVDRKQPVIVPLPSATNDYLLAHHALRRRRRRHRQARGAGRRAARDRAHARYDPLLSAGKPGGQGGPPHRRARFPGAAARARERAGTPL